MKLIWSKPARHDLTRLYEFIAEANVIAADKALDLIFEEADRLAKHPEIGRVMDGGNSERQWIFKFGSKGYAINYQLYEDVVYIARVWHASENH